MNRPLAPLFALIFTLAVPAAQGCATSGSVGDRASRAAANVLLPPKQEEQLGANFSDQIASEVSFHPNDTVQSYIKDLGKLAVDSARARGEVPSGIEFEFRVIDDDETINAFAGPGGQIYFYSGLLKQADSAAEVLAVMCHEVAHVTERHIAERLVAIYGLEALKRAALGEDAGVLGNLVSSAVAQGFLLKYSRSHETEADDTGLTYMLATGYDPRGFISFFELIAESSGPRPPQFLSSHPFPENRIANIRKRLEGRTNVSSKSDRQRHQEVLEAL
jgi:predicted Zn-dependent protease